MITRRLNEEVVFNGLVEDIEEREGILSSLKDVVISSYPDVLEAEGEHSLPRDKVVVRFPLAFFPNLLPIILGKVVNVNFPRVSSIVINLLPEVSSINAVEETVVNVLI